MRIIGLYEWLGWFLFLFVNGWLVGFRTPGAVKPLTKRTLSIIAVSLIPCFAIRLISADWFLKGSIALDFFSALLTIPGWFFLFCYLPYKLGELAGGKFSTRKTTQSTVNTEATEAVQR